MRVSRIEICNFRSIHHLIIDLGKTAVFLSPNNGGVAMFAALAKAFCVPWLAVLDKDKGGKNFKKSIEKRGFVSIEIEKHCNVHEAGGLETQLAAADGHHAVLCEILGMRANRSTPNGKVILKKWMNDKTGNAAELAARFRDNPELAKHGPKAFREAIARLPELNS